MVLYICKILNTAPWPLLPHDDDHDENVLNVQLFSQSISSFSGMDIVRDVRKEDAVDEYIEIVRFLSLFRFWKHWPVRTLAQDSSPMQGHQ